MKLFFFSPPPVWPGLYMWPPCCLVCCVRPPCQTWSDLVRPGEASFIFVRTVQWLSVPPLHTSYLLLTPYKQQIEAEKKHIIFYLFIVVVEGPFCYLKLRPDYIETIKDFYIKLHNIYSKFQSLYFGN